MKRICSIDNEYRDAYIDWDELEYVGCCPSTHFTMGDSHISTCPRPLTYIPVFLSGQQCSRSPL